MDFYTRSLAIKKEIADNLGIAHTLNNMSNIYYSQGDNTSTIDHSQRVLTLAQETGHVNEIRDAY